MSNSKRERSQAPRRGGAEPPPANDPDRLLTIDDFCRSERMSRRLYYYLEKRGQGPETMRFGKGRGIRRISREARQRWRERMVAMARSGA